MIQTDNESRHTENPFSTRFVRPGALPFAFLSEATAASLVQRFQQLGRRAQIVGPHGSGKSTLLSALVEAMRCLADEPGNNIGRVEWLTLHDGCRTIPIDRIELSPTVVLVVDGYEQLGWQARRRLARAVARSGAGMLVTTHSTAGLPTLYETRPTLELAVSIVEGLLETSPQCRHTVPRNVISRHYDECRGDLRELFFRLYDVCELRRS